jgi:hypothetical protein
MGVLEGILYGALMWAIVGVVCYILNWTLFRIGLIRNLMILILGIAMMIMGFSGGFVSDDFGSDFFASFILFGSSISILVILMANTYSLEDYSYDQEYQVDHYDWNDILHDYVHTYSYTKTERIGHSQFFYLYVGGGVAGAILSYLTIAMEMFWLFGVLGLLVVVALLLLPFIKKFLKR